MESLSMNVLEIESNERLSVYEKTTTVESIRSFINGKRLF